MPLSDDLLTRDRARLRHRSGAVAWLCMAVFAGLAMASSAHAQTMSVGNLVFLDANANGHYDAGEGVGNVRVELWRVTSDPQNPVIMTDTRQTLASGAYLFTGLTSGTYYVTIPSSEFATGKPLFGTTSLPGAQLSGDDDTGEDGQDTFDPAITGVSTMEFVVAPGFGATDADVETGFDHASDNATDDNVDLTIDFGFFHPVGVGNLVFVDLNGNGVADANEGVSGVAVQLFLSTDNPLTATPLSDVVTDSLGHYWFGGLLQGSYKVFIPPSQFGPGGPLQGALSMTGAGVVGDDDNATGVGHASDDGVDNAQPETNGIASGTITLAPGAEPTAIFLGETGSASTDDDGTIDADNDLTVDFGFTIPSGKVGVGNLVFIDFNNNGVADDGEGVQGVTVQLFQSGQTPGVDAPFASQVTQSDGRYLFANLYPGSYFLHVPKGVFAPSQPLFSALSINASSAGDDGVGEDGVDVPYPEVTGVSCGVFSLAVGACPTASTVGNLEIGYGSSADDFHDADVDLTHDLGFKVRASQPFAIGNLVFFDADHDGKFGVGDSGIQNVEVQLYHEGEVAGVNDPLLTTHTASNGTYLFTGLTPGRYVVHIPAVEFTTGRPLVGMLSITGNGGDNDSDDDLDENGVDSATPDASGISSTVIELSENNEPVEGGAFASMDDDNDRNGNLTVDFGFSPDCPVLTISPTVLASVVRDDPYIQTFTLAGGSGETWSVASGTLPTGLTLSASGQLSGTPTVSGTSSFVIKATLPNSCSAAQSYTLTVQSPAVMGVGNAVYVDTNGNGVFDPNEGLANVTLQLFRENTDPQTGVAIATQQTDAFGVYAFTGLEPGRYFIHVPAGNFQNGGPLYQKVSATGASSDDGVDDQVLGNDNGIDAVTPPATGVSSGVFELSEGQEPTDAGSETGVNAAADNANDANFDSTIDFAFVSSPAVTVAVGNLVFRDLNNNHVYDSGEGMNGVQVQLFNATDNVATSTPLRTTTTANGGSYLFGALEPGTYKVFIPATEFARGKALYGCLSITGAGTATAGDDNADENGIDSATPASTGIVSTNVVLALGTAPTASGIETGFAAAADDATDSNSNLTVDLGFALDCHTILIAPDTLNDGQLGTVYDVTFNASGGVAPYNYSLAFGTLPPGLALLGRGAISGMATSFGTYAFGVTVTDDYGCSSVQGYQLTIVSRPLGVGNMIFFDKNGNGHADEGEGMDGVTVQIYTSTQTPGIDAPLKTTTTSGGGRWLIDELQPGSYRVHVPAAMFASGAPLWKMRSMSGVLTSGDDDAGEDGEDALDPASTGVSTGVFDLYPGTMPSGAAESGLSGSSDNARDTDIDLTRDLGFVDLNGLPATFSTWQSLNGLSGLPTVNSDGDADNNLVEYAFAGNPSSGASSTAAFTLTEDQPTTRMSALVRRRHGGQNDVTYTLQVLPNLAQSPAGWISTTVVPTTTNNGDGTETLTFANVDIDSALNGSIIGFARVLVALDTNGDGNPDYTATSAVLGWQHRTLAIQHQTFGAAFVKPAVFTGTVNAVNGSNLDVATSVGAGSVVDSLTAGLSYYVEVIGGDNEGQRWEIDESATTATSIVLLPANALSTQTTVPANLAGDLIAVRPHWRVVDLFPPADYHATGSASTADQLLLWNAATSGYVTLYLNTVSGNKTWLKFGGVGLNIQDGTIIGPTDGTFARPRVGIVNATASGQVRTWKCALPLKTGLNFVGNPYPVAQSFTDRLMTVANGFTGGSSVNNSDKINYWNGDASTTVSYSVYFLFKNATSERWLRFGQIGGVDHAADKLFDPGTGVFINSIAGQPAWLLPVPWTP